MCLENVCADFKIKKTREIFTHTTLVLAFKKLQWLLENPDEIIILSILDTHFAIIIIISVQGKPVQGGPLDFQQQSMRSRCAFLMSKNWG